MPATLTYPGVYIEELSSGVHAITGVATSIAAFVGYTARGLDNRAQEIFSFGDFERSFGGLAADSELSYAVQQFFANGGTDAFVVRVPKNDGGLSAATAAAAAAATAKTQADAAAAANPLNAAAAAAVAAAAANPLNAAATTAAAAAAADPANAALAAAAAAASAAAAADPAALALTTAANNAKAAAAADPAASALTAAAAAAAAAVMNANANLATASAVGSAAASITLLDSTVVGAKQSLTVTALSRGAWANEVVIDVNYYDSTTGKAYVDTKVFNLTITDLGTDTVETFDDVTMDSTQSNYVVAVVNDPDSGSKMVSVNVPDATAGRPVETGTVGGDVTLTALQNDKAYSINITSDFPTGKITNVPVAVINSGDPLPASILGLCRLLERKINLALQSVSGVIGAAVHCVPGRSGAGVRVVAKFATGLNANDASLTFTAGAPNDVLDTLQLKAPVSVNVGSYCLGDGRTILAQTAAVLGRDGTILPKAGDLKGDPSLFTGIYALDKVDLFNILCLPDVTRAKAGDPSKSDLDSPSQNDVLGTAMDYCINRRAFLLIDAPPEVKDVSSAVDWKTSGLKVHDKNGAAYFPRLKLADSLNNSQLRTFAPCGVTAGLYSRIDASRGVWKAPAGTEATLSGVQDMVYKLTDPENGVLNPLGLNCFRNFPIYGAIAWGARTLVGSDTEGNEWKYVPVRRFALFLEESLYRGTKWVVFEPNDEPLWAQIRLNLGAFMQTLFRQGAFQGSTPKEAYFVKCDKETTTQNDIDLGIVNIVVGFAPLKPAEFVVIKIQQIAGQIQT